MKNKIHTWRPLLPALLVLLVGQIHSATVQWNGGPIVVTNVTDQNINISNANIMGSDINVHAVTQDILISVTLNDSSITSTLNNTIFCLQADVGRTITMNLSNTLAFIAGAGLTIPFIIDFQGPGQLVVNIEGTKQFVLTKAGGATVGTWFFVTMDAVNNPTVTFERNPAEANPNNAAMVLVDGLSLISYLGQVPVSAGTSTENGTIRFNPTNVKPNMGGLSLVLLDQSSFMVGGHLTNIGTCPHFGNISMQTPAGQEAILEVINTSTANSLAAFTVSNMNQVYSPNTLIDQFCLKAYTGILNGFTLQANGQIVVQNQSYILYEGLANDVAPLTDVLGACGWALHQVVKDRNPAAFTVDGNSNPNAIPAQIILYDESAIYLASEVNCGGCQSVVQTASMLMQVIPGYDVSGAGNIIMDVEGPLNIIGGPLHNSAINVLSLVVQLSGGSVLIEGTSTNFPLRTYLRNPDGTYQQFNKANILVNNIMRLTNTNLKHDDEIHNATVQFLPGNTLLLEPEPTYRGGERDINAPAPCSLITSTALCSGHVNAIEFYNSCFLLHTDAAATGLTLRVPNDVNPNFSCFKFYSNGLCDDNGGGRNLILGGIIGALATDGQHVIDPNAYIDVLQTTTATSLVQTLSLVVGYNNQKVTEGLTGNIQGQDVVQSIVQLYGSNICVGTDTTITATPPVFTLLTTPSLVIAGNYFNFITQGGQLRDASASGSSGQGGIYVDTNGSLYILPNLRALVGEVISVSGNGYVNLPTTQVLFWQGVGFQRWRLNLTQSGQQVVVPAGQNLSNFTIDWQTTVKDFCVTNSYVPYQFNITDPTTGCPFLAYRNPYKVQNMTGLPIIQGTVEQLQLKNSRIGDQAQAIVDGGLVREVVFLNNDTPGYAPVGTVIIQNNATVGIGTSNRNVTAVQAQMVLGTNGLTLVANGDGVVMLNQDVLINNLCHILTGTNFGLSGPQELLITSQVPREIRVKGTGILDLTQFGNYNQRLTIGGQVKIVLEPGAQIVQGSGELYLTDNAEMALEPYVGVEGTGSDTSNTDAYRVKFSSVCTGSSSTICPSRFTLQENSRVFIPRGAILGVETSACTTFTTSQSWFINDDAQFLIGGNETVDEYGGALQIGNTTAQSGSAIDWSLTINGDTAALEIGSQGFLGIGQGIVLKPEAAPDTWTIDSLSNVRNISINDLSGTIRAQSLFIGSNRLASLIALGFASSSYTFAITRVDGEMLGGTNVITTGSGTGPFNPVVGTTAGAVTSGSVGYSVGILASQASLLDPSKIGQSQADPIVMTGSAGTIFNFITMNPYNLQSGKTAVVAPTTFHSQSLGFVYLGTIYRRLYTGGFQSTGGVKVGASAPLQIGAAGLTATGNPPAAVASVLNP